MSRTIAIQLRRVAAGALLAAAAALAAPGGGTKLERWKAAKRRIYASKTWVDVGVSKLRVLPGPGDRAVIQVSFEQIYRSNNLSQRSRKRQYWVEEDGRWKIAYEARLKAGPVRKPASYPTHALQLSRSTEVRPTSRSNTGAR